MSLCKTAYALGLAGLLTIFSRSFTIGTASSQTTGLDWPGDGAMRRMLYGGGDTTPPAAPTNLRIQQQRLC